MPTEAEQFAIIDQDTVDSLKELSGADGKNFFAEIVAVFTKQHEEFKTKLETCHAGKDTKTAGKVLHQLRSSAGNIGAFAFSELCGEIEDNIVEGDGTLFNLKYSLLKEAYAKTVANLERLASSG